MKRLVVVCALASAAAPAAAADAPLGRMFFTPAQRAQLDIARTQRARTTLATEQTEEVATAAPVAQSITYDGAVRRSDGKTTVWINSRPVNDKEPAGAAIVGQVRPDGSVSLQILQSGRSVDLKPGQSIELLSGAIEDAFSRKPAPQPEPKPAAKPAPDAKGAKPAAANPAPDAKGAKPAAANPERARDERDREDRERQLDEAARALRDATTAKPATAAPPETPR